MEGFYVYAIVSKDDEIIYVGIAKDVEKRLSEHNLGKSRYTSGHMPWKIFYIEFVGNSKDARAREKYFKTASGKKKLRKILLSK